MFKNIWEQAADDFPLGLRSTMQFQIPLLKMGYSVNNIITCTVYVVGAKRYKVFSALVRLYVATACPSLPDKLSPPF